MRTTVALRAELRDRLRDLKRAWHLRSTEEVIERLLGGVPQGAKAIYREHQTAVDMLLAKHRVRRLVAFGSRARGDARPESDLDLVADLPPGTSLLGVVALKQDLEEVLGLTVNLLTPETLDDRLQHSVREDGVVLVG